MRNELQPFNNMICSGIGTITDIGFKTIFPKRRLLYNQLMILITNVKINNKIDIDHIWVQTKNSMTILIGDIIKFEGKIIKYKKKHESDYTFENIYNIEKIFI